MFIRKAANKISIAKRKPICGIAINDAWYITQSSKHGTCPIYRKWKDMISRSYSSKMHKNNPTYEDCSVCDEWLTFSNFLSWYEVNQVAGFDLDKDLKVKGNKIYSPDTCLFVPQEVNRLFADKPSLNRSLPTGVSFHKGTGKYRARISSCHIGLFENQKDAVRAYAQAMDEKIRILICKYPNLKIVLSQYLTGKIKSTNF